MAGVGRGAGGVPGGIRYGGDGFGASSVFNKGGGSNFLGSLGNFMGGPGFTNALDFTNTLGNLYGMNKSFDLAEDQLGLMEDQQKNAASAQNFSLANALAMQVQTTTPGTPEHAAALAAQQNGTYQAVSG